MQKRNWKRFLPGICAFVGCVLLASWIVWMWTGDGALLMGHDTGWRVVIGDFFPSLFYLWSPIYHFGIPVLSNPAVAPIHLAEFLSQRIANTPVATEQLALLFWHTVNLTSIMAAWIFLPKRIRKTMPLRIFILASLLYAINFFNLQGFSVFWRTRFSIQFILPISVFFLFGAIEERKIDRKKLVILALLTSVFNGGGSPPLVGSLAVGWFGTGLFELVTTKEKKEALFVFLSATVWYLFPFALFSAYWLIPYGYYAVTSYTSQLGALGGVGNIVAWSQEVSKNTSFINLFRLQALPSWDWDSPLPFILSYLSNPLLILASFAMPMAAISALVLVKTKEEKRFVGLVAFLLLISMFFTAGSHPPIGGLFNILLEHIPGFAVFRSPLFKFGMLVGLTISLLTAFTAVKISEKLRPSYRIVFFAVCMGFVAYYTWPFFQGRFFAFSPPFTNRLHLPQYTFDAAAYMKNNGSAYTRTLTLPQGQDQIDSYTWGYWSPDGLYRLVDNQDFVSPEHNPPQIVTDIYDSLGKNNLYAAFRLLGISSIDSVLWRDDALFSDKKTGALAYADLKAQLKDSPWIENKKDIGPWAISGIHSPYYVPRISTPTQLIETNAQVIDAVTVLGDDLATQSALIPMKTAQDLLLNPSTTLIKAIPVSCDSSTQVAPVQLPESLILPDSLLYPLTKWQEERFIARNSKTAAERIDTYLFITGKRTSELFQLAGRTDDAKTNRIIEDTMAQTNRNIVRIIAALPTLSQADLPTYQERVRNYFVAYGKELSSVEENLVHRKGGQTLFDTLGSSITMVTDSLVCASDPAIVSYHVNVPKDDTYSVSFDSRFSSPVSVAVDSASTVGEQITLTTGTHTIVATYPAGAFTQTIPDQEINLLYKKPVTIPLGTSPYSTRQHISFEYQVVSGTAPELIFHPTDIVINPNAIPLNSDSHWQRVDTVLVPSHNQASPGMTFSLCCYQTEASHVLLRNIVITSVEAPNIYFVKQGDNVVYQPPQIDFRRENLTRYRVHVAGATSPFVLQFQEQFDPYWRAIIVPDGHQFDAKKPLTTYFDNSIREYDATDHFFDPSYLASLKAGIPVAFSRHFVSNDYANTWVIDKTGTYDIILEFWPQYFVYVGLVISGISYIGAVIYLAKHHE